MSICFLIMRTTVDIPDALYRETKALAALTGRTVKDLITEILRDRLEKERALGDMRGWRSAFGKVSRAAAESVQLVVDDQFSRVDLGRWQ